MIVLKLLLCVWSLPHLSVCIPPKDLSKYDPPEIITAPPQPTSFELVVGTRFGSSGAAKPALSKSSRMETGSDLLKMGRFGLRLPKHPRRPSFESGFRPKPLTAILHDSDPVMMLPHRIQGPSNRRRPSRLRRPYKPANSSPVSVLSPIDDTKTSVPWPNLGTSGRPISHDVLEHLIKNVGGQLESLESQDTNPVTKFVRPTKRPTSWPTRRPTRRTTRMTTRRTTKATTVVPRRKTTRTSTTTKTPWPTGQVEPVARPPWLGNINVSPPEQEERNQKSEIRNIDEYVEYERDGSSLNVGTADITSFNSNETDSGEEKTKNPSLGSPMTTENLAYILIGGCTILSITFLVIVAVTIHCRKVFRQKKIMKDMRRSAYLRPMSWAHHGALSRSSPEHYLHGVKKSPKPGLVPWLTLRRRSFRKMRSRPQNGGALRYETVGIGNNKRIKRTTVALPNGVYIADGRRKVTGDMESFSTSGEGTCQCTCSSHLSSEEFDECSDNVGNCCGPHHNRGYNGSHCQQQQQQQQQQSPLREQRTTVVPQRCYCRPSSPPPPPVPCRMCHEGPSTSFAERHCQHQHNSRSAPAPVSGSNYLSNPDGLIFWSGNNDRLI